MSQPDRLRLRDLFARAADLPPDGRAAFLEDACRGEPGLRAEIESLLAYDRGTEYEADDGGFLKSPMVRSPETTLHQSAASPSAGGPGLPYRIGRYRILRRHAEGGMGTVYEAEQDSPRRTVALKVIRPGLLSPELVKRFGHEAEILARFQHPGIAQVHEAGMDDDGRPFFAMEFIRGMPLDEYARARGLSPAERLELLARVCDAVQHAHDGGVIHRDLKPANILVEESGQPRVLDFGVAHVTAGLLTTSSRTQTGQLLGTLSYMSPEQIAAWPTGLDARSDVYTLGVLLYELLAHRLPYPLEHQPVHEVARMIQQQEPSRLGSIDAPLRGDVETIVARAMEKDRTRRYASAGDLASDIRRHLRGEPIRARKVGAAARGWRWARRNPHLAALGGLLAGVLVLATVGSLLAARQFYTQAETQRGLAVAHRAARIAADRARAQEAAERSKADQANAGLLATQEELRQTIYATRCNLGLAAWYNNDVGRLRSLLGLLRPSAGEPDYRGWEWRYLWRLGHEDRLTLHSQNGARFTDVVYSPDGRTLATLDNRGRVQFWDWPTGRLRRTTGDPGRGADLASGVGALAFSPDGRRLAGPGPDASLVLYDVDTGLPALRLEGTPGAVMKLAWSPDGRTLVAAISAHVMRVWDAADGHLIHEAFGGHGGPVAAVAFSPDGRTLVSASFDRTVKLWNLEDPVHPLAVFKGHTDEVRAVAFSPDGRRVASAGLDQTLRIWDARSGAELAMIGRHGSGVTSLAYFPDGGRIATGSSDRTVRIWDTSTHREVRTFKNTDEFSDLAVSPDGRDVAAAADVTVRVFDAASPPLPRTLRSPSVLTYGGAVECLAFSPDGRRLVSGHDDTAVRVWDLTSDRPPRVLRGHSQAIKCVAFSPDGRTIASGGDATVRLWDAETGEPRLTFTGHTANVKSVLFPPDGRTILSGGVDRTIQAWDPATGVVMFVLRGHSDAVLDLALSPDGRTLASCSYDRTCILWDYPRREPRLTLRGHEQGLESVGFSPDGRTLATASEDDTVRLWDVADGSPRGILKGHAGEVNGLAFNPDGRLATSSWDWTIRLWDPATAQTLLILNEHSGRIRCIKFSPDGRTLASASNDRTIKLWEAAPAAVLAPPGDVPPKASRPATASPNHSPKFFVDEGALVVGTRTMASLAVNFLGAEPKEKGSLRPSARSLTRIAKGLESTKVFRIL